MRAAGADRTASYRAVVTTTDAQRLAQDLAAQIDRHRGLYARGLPELVDADYDAIKDELRALVAEHPELEPADSPLGKVNAPGRADRPDLRHARPMLSLAKATDRGADRARSARASPARSSACRRSSTASR